MDAILVVSFPASLSSYSRSAVNALGHILGAYDTRLLKPSNCGTRSEPADPSAMEQMSKEHRYAKIRWRPMHIIKNSLITARVWDTDEYPSARDR